MSVAVIPRALRVHAVLRAAAGLSLATAVACGPASSPRPPTGSAAAVEPLAANGSRPGTLSVSLAATPDPRIERIHVRVDRVTAHVGGVGWVALDGPPVDVDLLRLAQADTAAALGWTTLPAGAAVTQVRLLLAPGDAARGTVDPLDYVITPAGREPLEVPSGDRSGVKVLGVSRVEACSDTVVTLSLDVPRSIWFHRTGAVEGWILRPVIRMRTSPPRTTDCRGTAGQGGGGSGDGGAGAPCGDPADCLSNTCANGSCAEGGAGSPCDRDADCTTGACTDGTCAPGTSGWTGTRCTVPTECASNDCANGSCQPGGQGAPCRTTADCLQTLRCTLTASGAGSCQAPSY